MSERIYYATQQIAIAPVNSTDYQPVRGGQTLSLSETFPSQEIFQLGKLEIYTQLENLPSIEMTVTKVLDGHPLAYLLATRTASTPTLINRTNEQCKLALSVFDITKEAATGVPMCTAEMSGADVTSLSYSFTNDGAFEESVGFIVNDIVLSEDSGILNPADIARRDAINVNGFFTGQEDPNPIVNQRQHFIFDYSGASGTDAVGMMADPDATILPRNVPGITDSGTNEADGNGGYNVSVESISVSATLSREELFSLGTLKPTCRYLQVPIEVTTEITFRAYDCPFISATADGVLNTGVDACDVSAYNIQDQSIRIATCEGTRIYLGRKNRLQSHNYSGGDTSGGNVTVSQTYRTFNDFTVMHENDTATNASTWWTNRDTYLTAQ